MRCYGECTNYVAAFDGCGLCRASIARDALQRNCYKEQDGESVKEWLWSGSRIVAEYDYADNTTSVFVYAGATAPAYMIRSGVTYRIITDNQGSVRLVVNAETSEVAQRIDYDSFGRVLRDTNPGFQPFAFQGGLYDPDTGLVEFGCRWYDAETGRWISKDPIGLRGGLNLYEFCEGCPTVFSDPLGFSRVIISMVDGSKQTLRNPSLDDFRNAIKGCADGSIMALTIYDHGTFNSMDINGEGDGVVINPVDNSVRFTDNNTLLSGLLGPKMANGGTVLLSGCRTADYRNALDRVCKWVCDWLSGAESEDPCPEWLNISKALSMELPSIKVVGNRTYALGNKYGPTWNIGWRRSYVNGK